MTASTPARRIALFTGNYVNIVDGVALTLNRLVRHLQSRGHEVVVFGPEGPTRALKPNGEFIGLPSIPAPLQPEYRFALRMPRTAQLRLKSLRPDIVHIATPDRIGNWALRYGRSNHIPVVTSFHSNIVSYLDYVPVAKHLQRAGWWYFRRFYRQCQQIYVPTQSMADELREHGIDNGLRIWARGVDTERFSPTRRDLEWRRSHGIADDERLILFVARLRWEKGLKVLADVIGRLERDDVPHRSMIVGEGVGYEPLKSWLPRTIFTGKLDGVDLARAYASADLFLYPSATETFGNVILEAMASGLPSICADAPGSRSVAVANETSKLATPENREEFYTQTRALLDCEDTRRQFAANSLERAQAFSWNAAMDSLIDHYEEVLAGPSQSTASASPPA